MAVHGFKVNKAELQNFLDNLTARESRKQVAAGRKLAEEIGRYSVQTFYARYGRPDHKYSSIENSIRTRLYKTRQDQKYVYNTIEFYIDDEVYLGLTNRPYVGYNIYKWIQNPEHRYEPIGAANFVLGMQYFDGNIGLPYPLQCRLGSPLYDLLKDTFDLKWNYRGLRKYLEK